MSRLELHPAPTHGGLPQGPSTPARRRVRPAAALALVLAAVALAGLCAAYVVAARAAYGGNSDDATLVLQGQSMATGHLTLSGWDLSYDAFWTSDVPFYGLAVALFGVREHLMYLVPAVIALLLALVTAWVSLPSGGEARQPVPRRLARRAAVPVAVVLAVLGLPNPVLAYFLLQAGWHAVTALLCLIAFAAVAARRSGRAGLFVAVVAVAAGLLGDLLTAVLALVPLGAGALVAVRRTRSWRAAARPAIAAAGGCLLALGLRLLALAVGTYAIGSRNLRATSSQVLANLASLPDRVGGLFGVTDIAGGSSPWPLRAVHALVLAGVLAALGGALAGLVRGLIGGRRTGAPASTGSEPGGAAAFGNWASPMLDDLLGLAIVADVVAYCVFATDSAVPLARYLVPGVAFATVLAARRAGSLAARLGARRRRAGLLALAAITACCLVDFGVDTLGPPASQEARPLATFLVGHHLRAGIGDYWSASITTVDSGGSVAVRPVQLGPHGSLVRYTKQSDASWYAGRRFDFFVSDTANPWQGVTSAAAVRSFGSPAKSYEVGTYRILVWPHPVRVSS
jgi:hypothetical protein